MGNVNKIGIHREPQRERRERTIKGGRVLFAEAYLTLALDTELHWLYADWLGYQTEGSVTAGCGKTFEYLQHTPWPRCSTTTAVSSASGRPLPGG